MTTPNTKTYDIVILPDDSLTKKAIELSEQLGETYVTRFTLGEKTNYPHYSIYMAQLDENGVEEAKKHLAEIVSRFTTFKLEATHYWQDSAEGFFEIQYKCTPELIALQEHVIKQINPLREGLYLTSYPPGYTKGELEPQLTGNALEQLQKYGYPEIGEDYRPHMTFTRLQKTALAIKMTPDVPPEEFSGNFPILGLYVMGSNGTCIKKVADLSLP